MIPIRFRTSHNFYLASNISIPIWYQYMTAAGQSPQNMHTAYPHHVQPTVAVVVFSAGTGYAKAMHHVHEGQPVPGKRTPLSAPAPSCARGIARIAHTANLDAHEFSRGAVTRRSVRWQLVRVGCPNPKVYRSPPLP